MTKRAVLYARVSGDDRGKEGRNLAGQLEMCRNYAQEHGYQVVAELSEDDRGASGFEIDLPKLNRVREMARANELDVLIVRELDRLSRNLAKQLIVEQELQGDGVKVEYVLYDFPDTPEGRLNKHVRAMLAEYEREKITERTTRAKRRKVETGHVMVHSRAPYGYRLEEMDGKQTLMPYEPEAQIIRLIFQWYTDDEPMSLSAIIQKLNGMGIPTRMGGKRWRKSTVWGILRSETYAGIWYYGKKTTGGQAYHDREHWIAVEVPAIIPRELWEKAQGRLEENKRNAKRNTKYEYLLRYRVTCGECRYAMSCVSTIQRGKLYLYYRCPCAQSGTGVRDYVGKCSQSKHFRADHVDAVVWDWVKSFLTNPVVLIEGLKAQQVRQEIDNAPLRNRLAVVDTLLADNQQKMERLLDLYLVDGFPKEVLIERREHLLTAIEALKRERTVLAAQLDAQVISDKQLQTIEELAREVVGGLTVADADFVAQRRLIEELDVRATLAVESGEKVIYVQCMLGAASLLVLSTTSPRCARGNARTPPAPWRPPPAAPGSRSAAGPRSKSPG